MKYISKRNIAEVTGHPLHLIHKFFRVAGDLPGPVATVPGGESRRWERGHELESTVQWLRARIPAFTNSAEERLRAVARGPLHGSVE